MEESNQIIVEKLHTDEMVKDEVRTMLGATDFKLTLGMVEGLWLIDSPYIKGGAVTPNDVECAMKICCVDANVEAVQFHKALQESLDTAFRVFDIFVPDDDPLQKKQGKTSEIGNFSPEWLSDIIAQACQSMPSLTYNQILYEIPLVSVYHLAMSTARRNGAITARPNDMKSAIEQFKELQKRKKKEKEGK